MNFLEYTFHACTCFAWSTFQAIFKTPNNFFFFSLPYKFPFSFLWNNNKKEMARMQAYFNSEFLASGLNSEMYDFLKRITQAKSKAVKYTIVLFFI